MLHVLLDRVKVLEVDIVLAQALRVLDDFLDKVCTLLLVEGVDEVYKRSGVFMVRSILATFDTPVMEVVFEIIFLYIVSAARHNNLDENYLCISLVVLKIYKSLINLC